MERNTESFQKKSGKKNTSMADKVSIKQVRTSQDLRDFINFPWEIYKNSPNWSPPLKKVVKQLLDFENHPFWKHAEGILFLAEKDGKVAGRISAQIDFNYNNHWKQKVGSFGFFESINDEGVASALFNAAENWIKKRRMNILRGPMSPSPNAEFGFLYEGFDKEPSFMTPYNPPYYISLAERHGLKKAKELLVYGIPHSLETPVGALRVASRLKKNPRISIRKITKKTLKSDIKIIKNLFNECWKDNWGFTPVTDEESAEIANAVKNFGHEETSLLAYYDNKPAGMYIALPDINQLIKKLNGKFGIKGMLSFIFQRGKITRSRTFIIGIKERLRNSGLVALMYCEADKFLRKRYKEYEFGWVLEDNVPAKLMMDFVGGVIQKRYYVMEKTTCPVSEAYK